MLVDMVEDMVGMVVVTMAKDLLNLVMDMVEALDHMVAMEVDMELMVGGLVHMVAIEEDMVEVMDLAMEAIMEAIL